MRINSLRLEQNHINRSLIFFVEKRIIMRFYQILIRYILSRAYRQYTTIKAYGTLTKIKLI
jgi:hypothetical protein